jgi:hypothetical protein
MLQKEEQISFRSKELAQKNIQTKAVKSIFGPFDQCFTNV